MNQIPNIEETNTREFMECETCSKKPGSPHLCDGCLHNRSTIENLIEQIVQNEQYLSTEDYIHFLRETLQKIQQTHHQQLQKAREERKGWKGYVAVDPKADNYKYSPVFSDRKGAELWVKGKEINGLEVVEVDILLVDHSELDQDKQ